MRLVDDHEIEVPDAETRLATLRLVNQSHHRRIRAGVDSTRRGLLGDEVHRAGLGQVCFERTHGLVHQRHPVGQEQRPLHPTRPLQQVHQCNRRACLAAASGHHQQRLASRLCELLADAANGSLLVVPLDDVVLHLRHIERGALGSANDQGREFVLLVEPGDRTWRVGEVIPQAGLVPVGVEDDRALAMHRLQAVGVELRLLLAHRRVDGGLLRLHHRQRLAVVSPENIVGIAGARLGRHARHFVFTVLFQVQRPTGAFQSEIDNERAGLVLVPIVGLVDALVLRFDGREAFTQRFQFALNLLAGLRRRIPLGLQSLQLLDAGWDGCRFHVRDEGFVEGLALQTLRALAQVGAARPVEDVIQLPYDIQRLVRCRRSVAVDRHVASLPDVFGLLPHDLRHEFAECRVADVAVQVRDLRWLQSLLDLVDTLEQALQWRAGHGSRTPVGRRRHAAPQNSHSPPRAGTLVSGTRSSRRRP